MTTARNIISLLRIANLRLSIFCFLMLLLSLTSGDEVNAWKPITHVYFTELILEDVTDDGMVTVFATDYSTGTVRRDSRGNPIEIGTYPVSPENYAALMNYPAQFRAGSIGPDAYPDMITGQQVIHPAGRDLPGEPPGVDINVGGPGPDPWLSYLYSRAFTGCNPDGSFCNTADNTPANQAFVLGFLAHAAGDMYAHTFVNYYTGGPFHFTPLQENAIKHIVLEGYIDKRTPPIFSYDASLDEGVSDFIYRTMINATPRSLLDTSLLTGTGANASLPRIFSVIGAQLQRDIEAYDVIVANYISSRDEKLAELKNCLSLACVAGITEEAALILAEMVTYQAWVNYQKSWLDDINKGLKALPAFSHELSLALFFNPDGADLGRAQELTEAYRNEHLLSMLGAPDEVGEFFILYEAWINALPFDNIREVISRLEEDLLNYILEQAFGTNLDELTAYITNPEQYFDRVMSTAEFDVEGLGNPITLETLNPQLGVEDRGYEKPGEYLDYTVFPAAYNSVVMTKLLLMTPAAVNQLLTDLGSSQRFSGTNAMLGFIGTLDGSRQWNSNPSRMIMAIDVCAYQQIFLQQVGEMWQQECEAKVF